MPTSQQQSSHWLDTVITDILAWQQKVQPPKLHVDDMKTPSGRVHTGALRGVVLHDLVAKALGEKAAGVVSTYVFNDFDVMDGLPTYLDKSVFEPHMGEPLYRIPAPSLEHSGIDVTHSSAEEITGLRAAKNFAELYATDFIHAFRHLGCTQEIVWSHELYESGAMDEVIKMALDNVDKIKKIYKEVADYALPEHWYPFQVVCPECGKLGTTLVTNWDGSQIEFSCVPDKVTWAKGCGYTGKTSPFGGTGKLLWKVDWPAHWAHLGITIEGAGKDHTSAGGSRDMANQLITQVFGRPAPFDIPYEWILLRGAKMSSSKGVGTSAREFIELFPPSVGRFLFAYKPYGQVIDFDPATMAIPDLFDEYDQAARIFWKQEEGDERLGRSFEISQVGDVPAAQYLPRFRDVAVWMQHPELVLEEKVAEVKGSALTDQERQTLTERVKYARIWVSRYAGEEFQLSAKPTLPEQANQLSEAQRVYLGEVEKLVSSKNWEPAELQQSLFDLAKSTLGARQGFEAIYLSFLGKKAGPRAAWFLLSIDEKLRQQRIAELTTNGEKTATTAATRFPNLDPGILTIAPSLHATYPSLQVGVAIIKGVQVAPSSPELLQEMKEVFAAAAQLSADEINTSRFITSYRRAIKESGIDWHSRRPTADALLRRINKGTLPPAINNIADIGNLLSVKHHMSQGLFDLQHVALPVVGKEAKGGEAVRLFGESVDTVLKPGEICYFDQTGPFQIDLCWRDAVRTSITENTTDLLIQTDAVYDITREDLENMLEDLIAHVLKYAGGTLEVAGIVESST
jgi:lysyl-tRNA synthetase class 1